MLRDFKQHIKQGGWPEELDTSPARGLVERQRGPLDQEEQRNAPRLEKPCEGLLSQNAPLPKGAFQKRFMRKSWLN